MRALALIVPLLVAAPLAAHADDPTAPFQLSDEDDPKVARGETIRYTGRRAERATPTFQFGYRRLTMRNLDDKPLDFNVVEIDLFPISMKWFRVGLDLELGFGQGPQSHGGWFLTSGVTVGIQYPWRVTPFADFRFCAGLIGGEAGGAQGISFAYMVGLETGIAVYIVDRFYLTGALGWVHPVYRGIDVEYAMSHPLSDPIYKDFAYDSFTFKIGFGL
jgi:hypothetical protein